jgi:hypothetical protein
MKTMAWLSSILFGLALALACLGAEDPFFEGLGSYTRTITTSSPEAQRYFNQGLAFLHGFNHGAAIRSFQQAAELDPECAMAHWAIALASGPHINYPLVPPPAAERAWKELGLAKQYAPHASPVERELIEASPHPERANGPADRLRTLQPGIAHNVHMPSHIDIRCGRWHEAIAANLNAVEADRRYRAIAGPPTGFLPMYVAHNEHMLAYAEAILGVVTHNCLGENGQMRYVIAAVGLLYKDPIPPRR